MNTRGLIYFRRTLLVVCALAVVWTAVLLDDEGFVIELGLLRISSRNPRNPFILAVISLAGAAVLSRTAQLRGTLGDEWRWWKGWLAPFLAPLARLPVLARPGARLLGPLASAQAVAALGLVLYAQQWAAAPPLWLDEEMIALNLRERRLVDLAGSLWLGQSAPFGWLAIQRALLVAFGAGEHALRFLPALFGAGTIVVALWIGRRWFGLLASAALVLLCMFGRWVSHYPFELKHYSADAFWGLLLPALVVWALEADEWPQVRRRSMVWWAAAAVGQWLANGALFVAPACAIFLAVAAFRRFGARRAAIAAAPGLVWLASFALHYQVSLGSTHQSAFLRGYWVNELPPASAGAARTLGWLARRVEPLALDPGGTALWGSFWLAMFAAAAYSVRRPLAIVYAGAPLSAFVLAGLGVVPLYGRFFLWAVPAFYVATALVLDTGIRHVRESIDRRRRLHLAIGAALVIFALRLSADIVLRGREDLAHRDDVTRQGLDDRAAASWLMAQRRAGDAVMTTRLAWPALWWYGGIPVRHAGAGGRRPGIHRDHYEMSHLEPGTWCDAQPLRQLLQRHRRVLVYLGLRDVPPGYDALLVQTLERLGSVTVFRRFTNLSQAFIVELGAPPLDPPAIDEETRAALNRAPALKGCVGIRPAIRW